MIQFGTVSPLRQEIPKPHHPDQTVMFPSPLDMTFGPLAVTIVISLHRNPRMKCAACGHRRVCFHLGLGEAITSPPVCAKCAGLRSQ